MCCEMQAGDDDDDDGGGGGGDAAANNMCNVGFTYGVGKIHGICRPTSKAT